MTRCGFRNREGFAVLFTSTAAIECVSQNLNKVILPTQNSKTPLNYSHAKKDIDANASLGLWTIREILDRSGGMPDIVTCIGCATPSV
jgi:hypothetical protein